MLFEFRLTILGLLGTLFGLFGSCGTTGTSRMAITAIARVVAVLGRRRHWSGRRLTANCGLVALVLWVEYFVEVLVGDKQQIVVATTATAAVGRVELY
jgi:hypothetical protein